MGEPQEIIQGLCGGNAAGQGGASARFFKDGYNAGYLKKRKGKEGKISKLEGGDSGQTYLVNHNKKKFVLREYENEKAADYYVMVHKKLQQYGFFPNLYYKEKNKILFEYIDGRDCKKSDALKVAYQVGKICATINKLKLRSVDKDSKNVNYALELFRKNNFLNEEDIRALEVRYETMRNKLKPKLKLKPSSKKN